MAISLKTAQGAVKALREQQIVYVMSSVTNHALEGHLTKANAKQAAAAEHKRKGYFKKVVEKYFSTPSEFNKLPSERYKKPYHIYDTNKPFNKVPAKKDYGVDRSFSSRITVELQSTDYTLLANSSFSNSNSRYFQAAVNPNSRFLYVSTIPKSYVGRSIEATDDTKEKAGLDWAVIVIETGAQTAKIITMYPADQNYIGGLTALA